MNKITYILLIFVLSLSTTIIAQPQEIKSGLQKISIDDKSYESYLKKISYATPVVLPKTLDDTSEITNNIGKRITLLGFIKNVSQNENISTGYLYNSIKIAPDSETTPEPTVVMFETKEKFDYKPFEVYQVTGTLNTIASDTLASFVINADFAEPQGEFSKTVNEPNMENIIKDLPVFEWFWLNSSFDPEYSTNASISFEIPENIKKFDNKIVRLQVWFHDKNNSTNNGIRVISSLHPAEDACPQCSSQTKNSANTASIMLRNKMPDRLRGGIFAGKLSLNSKDEWSKLGVFTLKDAVLVSTMSYSKQIANSPEITGE